jgi:long-subunit acyl-CoA synthetase (AMP-forming)
MLGIQVLQVYGLTETTAICTMDVPGAAEPGWVGQAIPGMEMKLADNQEIIVRGPNIFSGYWNRPQESAKVLRDGWFFTGDQGEMNADGNWRIVGRIKNPQYRAGTARGKTSRRHSRSAANRANRKRPQLSCSDSNRRCGIAARAGRRR